MDKKWRKFFCITVLCGISIITLSGCNNIYKVLSDGTEKIFNTASDTVGDVPKDVALDMIDTINDIGGKSVLTSENSLEGKRITGVDTYAGTYSAEYENYAKTEYLFGGTETERKAGNTLSINCTLEAIDGTAKVFLISGNNEPVTLLEITGTYSDTLTLIGGGNYIGIECDNYTGSIHMNIE